MAKMVITGATGMIGRELTRRLTSRGDQVVALSRDAERARSELGEGVETVTWQDPLKVPPPLEALAGAETVIALEGVNDHENIGAIFRGAAGLGAQALLFGAGCADPLYRRTVRVSMGHVLRVPFAHSDHWPGALDRLRGRGYTVVSLTPDPAAPTLAGALAELRGRPVVLLVGAEGPGLAERTMRRTDIRARIPMTPGADSLNVATAATLACYERARVV